MASISKMYSISIQENIKGVKKHVVHIPREMQITGDPGNAIQAKDGGKIESIEVLGIGAELSNDVELNHCWINKQYRR